MDSPLVTFFKPIISSTQPLRLPKAFVNQIHGDLPEEAFLIDKYKNQWRVGVSKDGEYWCFDKGWSKFYEDNSIEIGDFMVFEHKRNNLFHFKLFGANACEKKVVSMDDGIKREEVDLGGEHGGIRGISFDDVEEKDHDDEEEEEDMIASYEDDDYEDEDKDDDDDNDYSDDDYEEEEEEEEERPKKRLSEKKKSSTQSACKARKRVPCQQKDWYGLDIFKSGLAPKPLNPYFVTRSRKGRHVDKLMIPNQILSEYGLAKPRMVTLKDEAGRMWKGKTRQWRDGRVWCTRPWKGLCRVNNIEPDDICICEIKQQGGSGDEMLIHVVSVVDVNDGTTQQPKMVDHLPGVI